MNKNKLLILILTIISIEMMNVSADQYLINYNIPIGLSITSFSPLSDPITIQGTSQTFNITLNKMAGVIWYMNGSQIQTNSSTTIANYTNSSAGTGIWNMTVIVTDGIDSISKMWNWTINIQSTMDITSPNTNISLNGRLGNAGWYLSNVTVTLNASDDMSGINYTKYRINSGAWYAYTIPFNVSTAGMNNMSYYSVDNSNNIEQTQYQIIKIDKTVPAAIASLNAVSITPTNINWTWTDPSTNDFSHVMIFINSIFKTNVTKGTKYYNATDLIPNTAYRISTHTVDIAGNINLVWRNNTATTAKDNKPPNGVTNLTNITFKPRYINWTWIDPSNIDFSKVMIYVNNAFKTNVTKGRQFYNSTGLVTNTSYTIGTKTVDTSGNVNMTWVNRTAKTSK